MQTAKSRVTVLARWLPHSLAAHWSAHWSTSLAWPEKVPLDVRSAKHSITQAISPPVTALPWKSVEPKAQLFMGCRALHAVCSLQQRAATQL